MKILKKGKPKQKKYTVTCRECATKFEFEEIEGNVVHDQRDGDFIQIECPTCDAVCTCNTR